jgi:ferredoxin--NADP+ reductase
MIVEVPQIARKAHAGNFIIIRINEQGERFPLTVADYDREKGTITIVVQIVGKSTKLLSTLGPGDTILDIAGPLGNAIEVKKLDHPVVIIGGGVGIAPCYPQAKELKVAGNRVISILGARTSQLLFWQAKMAEVSDEVIICTDDGSEGQKGVVTDPLKMLMKREPLSLVIAIGPLIMMKFVVQATNGKNPEFPKVKTMVSLNPIMVDGTGMCGGCRFKTVSGEVFFSCVDGPDVDGHIVDFDNLMARAKRYKEQEGKAMEHYDHQCKALAQAKGGRA